MELDQFAEGGGLRVPAGERTRSSASPEGCAQCGRLFPKARPHQRFCRDACRLAYFKARQAPAPTQAMIEWTPSASSKAHAVRGRETKAQAILRLLESGPQSSYQLAQVTHRFGARLLEIRKQLEGSGRVIEREDHCEDGREWSTYRLR